MTQQLTPMFQQYFGIKEAYPDAVLLFRMGDFYEMFFEDARKAARILGITLTARGTHRGEKVPMCGIPHHAAKSYIARLVGAGLKAAICEQVEDPKQARGIVKREVVRVITPGSAVDDESLDAKTNLFMAAVCCAADIGGAGAEERFGLAHLDVSTGEFRVTETGSLDELRMELSRIAPAELLAPEQSPLMSRDGLAAYPIEPLETGAFHVRQGEGLIKEVLNVPALSSVGCEGMGAGIGAAGALIRYLQETQKGFPSHIHEIKPYRLGDFMALDEPTRAHLELLRTMRRQSVQGSLYQVLDKTVTPMGGRALKKWISYPLIHLEKIRQRLGAVSCFKEDPLFRERIRETLANIYDLERLNGRVSMGRANARDLLALQASTRNLPFLRDVLEDSPSILLSEIAGALDPLEDVAEWIEAAIQEDPPVSITEGGIIKEGFDAELDQLISMSRDGKSWIAAFAVSEQKRTGIGSLKVGYNKVFGYYIEVSKANLHLVPSDYIRKQTLANGERYVTEELKVKEEAVLHAEEKRVRLEAEIFERIRSQIAAQSERIRATADRIAQLDVLASMAEAAADNDYVCPDVNDGLEIDIVEGRHPVIERTVKEETFVPNDIHLDGEFQQVLIITGPNMAGKSTILRQTALTVLMAQIGSFVPAASARIGIVDRIFTRVGASDDLARGKSTFMVEMSETANILANAEPRSLVVLDEIGRGTSTYDGLSIAWAVAEDLHDRFDCGVRTLFATHYHELTELAGDKSRVKNFTIAIREWNEQIVFLRKLVPGGASRSYGIEVARIAGLPQRVLARAGEILENLEGGERETLGRNRGNALEPPPSRAPMTQLSLFPPADAKLREWVGNLDLDRMPPINALLELHKLKEYVESLT